MSKIDNITFQNITTVEELRAATETGFSKLVAQLNRSLTTVDLDVNQHRITNVGYPADLGDAVNVEFLKNMVGRIALPKGKGGGGGGTGVGGYDKATFGVAIDTKLITGVDVAPQYVCAANSLQLVSVQAKLKIAATGADVVFTLNKNASSVLSTNFTIAAGSTAVTTWAAFDVVNFILDDVVTIDIVQTGSTLRGSGLIVVMKFKILNAGPL
jgi:hypothetical protein